VDQWASRQRKCGGADELAERGLARFISKPDRLHSERFAQKLPVER